MARKDFVGWTGLPPIAELIEYIFGIRADMEEGRMTIDVHLTDGYGIDRYPLGENGQVSIKVAKRNSTSDRPKVTIKTDIPFKVTLIWGDGQTAEADVKAGQQTI